MFASVLEVLLSDMQLNVTLLYVCYGDLLILCFLFCFVLVFFARRSYGFVSLLLCDHIAVILPAMSA